MLSDPSFDIAQLGPYIWGLLQYILAFAPKNLYPNNTFNTGTWMLSDPSFDIDQLGPYIWGLLQYILAFPPKTCTLSCFILLLEIIHQLNR